MSESLSMDQVFLNRLIEIVQDNLSNENFGVVELAKEAGMSRSSVHRKLRSITHHSVSQFIREIRLQHAMGLLQQNVGTASEIAFRAGFGSPAYFNKCFHEYYGFPPGEVKKRILSDTEQNNSILSQEQSVSEQESGRREQRLNGRRKFGLRTFFLTIAGVLIFASLAYFFYNQFIKKSVNAIRLKDYDKSIVVLPFKNLSDDPNNQYFADGIMEDILNNLFQVSELRVISRTTSEHFLGSSLTAKEVALKVNTRYVLEGSVRRYGDNTRISVQLIDAYRDQHLWSGNFDRELTDIIGIQSNIARQVALKLNAVLTDNEIRKIAKIPTRSPEAYDYYLQARFLVNKTYSEQRADISKAGLMTSLQYYEKAIAADENFVEAYAGLADAWYNLSAWGWYQPYFEGIRKARDFSSQALEIDTACAEAHAVKGACLLYPERRFEAARMELLTSIRLNPNFSVAHQWYAQLLMITGPIEEARVYMDRVLELEPYFWLAHNLNSWICYFEGKHKKGIDACLIGRDLNQYSLDNDWLFIIHFVKLGEGENAARELKNIFTRYLKTNEYENEISDAYKKSGIKGLFTWLIDLNIRKPVPLEGMNGHPFYIAWWYAILGDKNESVSWLKKASESQHIPYQYFDLITTNPDFDFVRDDPGFIKILQEVGLSPYNKGKAK
jgi:TolB-like protein/AraC-like DNA-binding protein